ncbi:DUF4878 domain-containing protein [Luteimonas sp. FCS-9]|uniref:DUF4878 domain-containing protein n=1 Tax=Luteimonas sp. FCS-9 TaxID=1547516 RepID=UPI000658F56C|nr:DUF4878 domain-containing protein [Luteimonas sp. FCS-9]KLI98708.1 hypothetical protein WQ56_14310 [Luteimonas sp. FCS-9]
MRRFRLSAVFFLMFATLALAACSSGKPEAAVEAFYEAAAKGDVEKATAQVSFADVPANGMVQAKGKVQMIVGEMQSRIDANDGLDEVEVLESTVDEGGETARVQVRVVFANGKDLTETHRMVRDDGKWKIRLR